MHGDLRLLHRLKIRIFLPILQKAADMWNRSRSFLVLIGPRMRYSSSLFYKSTQMKYSVLKKDRGAMGEYLLYDRLRKIKGKWLFNLYLPTKNEKTEIDSVLICGSGLFVFESKNFSGRIYGLESQTEWSHTFRTKKGIKKQKFFNPLMQNGAHKNALRAILPFEIPICPVAVFGRNSKLYTPAARERKTELTKVTRVRRTVRMMPKNRIDERASERIYEILSRYTNASDKEKREHIIHVSNKKF